MRVVRRYVARLFALIALAGVGFAIWYVIRETPQKDTCPSEAFPTKEFRKDVKAIDRKRANASAKTEGEARELARRAVKCEEIVNRNEPSLRALLGKPTRRKSDPKPTLHENWTWIVGGNSDALLVEVEKGQAVYARAPGAQEGGKPLSKGTPAGE